MLLVVVGADIGGVGHDDVFGERALSGDFEDEGGEVVSEVVVSADTVRTVLAGEGVVEVDVVGLVASGCGCVSVASTRLVYVWCVEAYLGCGRVVFVGKRLDVADWSVEPSASTRSTSGVVDTHGAGVKCVGACGCVEFADEGCELFLLFFRGCGVVGDFGDGGP